MLKLRYDPHPAVVAFERGRFDHVFGGPARHHGSVPEGHQEAMHLFLDLDLTDPLVPVEGAEQLARLPLYYPLRYGFGGGEAQYRIDSESAITILGGLENTEPDDVPETSFPDAFPERPVSIKALSYEQFRAVAVAQQDSNHYRDDRKRKQDRRVLERLSPYGLVRFGHPDSFRPIQGDITWPCANPECEYSRRTDVGSVSVAVFAQFDDALSQEISIWTEPGESPSMVEIYFGLISCCKTIVAVNRCT